MKEWASLPPEERRAARTGRSEFEARESMNSCLNSVLGLVKGNAAATNKAWKISWGNYLINTPEEIAEHLTI